MIKAIQALVALTALLTVLSVAAWAGPLQDANRAYGRGDYAEALRLLQQAKQDQPDNPVVHHALGLTFRRLGQQDEARAAFEKVLQLDPDLRSIRDDAKFLQAYRSVGGTPPSGSRSSGGGNSSSAETASAIIGALTQGNVYVDPDLKGDVDQGTLENAARGAQPAAKIVVLSNRLSGRQRERLAAELHQRLNVGDGVVIVATEQGVGAYGNRLGRDQVARALKGAGLDQAFQRGGLTEMTVAATRAVSTAVRSDRSADNNTTGGLLLLGGAGVAGFIGFRSLRKRRELETALQPVLALQRKALDNLSYVDGYLDLLPAGEDADRARSLRQNAYEEYATASGILKNARTPDDARRARPLLDNALAQLEECRVSIDKATGGTGVAMSIPEIPSLATDAERAAAARLKPVEAVQDERERDQMQRAIEELPEGERGVSFFSGRPLPMSELVPVTIVIQGQKRQVLASREEAEAIQRGETPNIRAFEQDGRYVPWYENQRYDPYRDYYGGWGGFGGGGFGSLVNLYLLTNLFGGGLFGGYGGFGGWGHGGTVINNNYYGDGGGGGGFFGGGGGGNAPEPEVEHAGSFDLFGQGGESDPFGGFDFGGGGDGGGGFDFGGGGDFGGGDFGGGD